MTAEGTPRTAWLLGQTAPQAPWIALDIWAPHHATPVENARRPPPELAGALLFGVCPPGDAELLTDGTLLTSRELLWSLLLPREVAVWHSPSAAATTGAAAAPLEDALRDEVRRLWSSLEHWAARSEQLRRDCRRLLDGGVPRQGRIVDFLDRIATRRASDPFGGWSPPPRSLHVVAEAVAPEDRGAPALPLPDRAADIGRWMAAAGGFGRMFGPRFAARREQAAMAGEVAASLADRRALLIEAGTGVGKTLAYLVPLVAHLVTAEGRAVVATHTRALQRQILEQDWPRVAPLAPSVSARLLMGRSNYLCGRSRATYLRGSVETAPQAARRAALLAWLDETTTGLREELVEHPLLGPILHRLFDTTAPCAVPECYEEGGCWVQHARRRAREARLLVVNHALLLQDLRADRAVLGPYRYLVVDEAHQLPATAVAAWSVRCDRSRLDPLTELGGAARGAEAVPERIRLVEGYLRAYADGGPAADACADLGRRLVAVRAAYHRWWESLGGMTPPATGETPAGGALRIHDKDVAFAPVRVETDELLAAAEAGCTAVTVLAQRVRELAGPPDESLEDNLGLLVRCEPLLAGVADDVRRITADPDDRWVTWCETGPGPGPRGIGATPLFAGELLRDLWYGADLAPVATSATLSVAGDFTHLIGELGLDRRRPSVMTRRIASPFDYARQARFFAPQPETFPDPDQAGYADAVADVLRELVTTLPRRALALFTSYRLLDEVAARLESGLPFAGVPEYDRVELIAQQSRGGAEELMRRLRRRRRALLLGTATFWEGVDLPGEQLELLVVTKLPFRVPSDPWVEARCAWLQAQGENPFTSFILRDAVVRLLQGVGRLVRSSEDRGVVVFLDTRLHAREYGITFLDALPGTCALFRDARDLAARAGTFFSAG